MSRIQATLERKAKDPRASSGRRVAARGKIAPAAHTGINRVAALRQSLAMPRKDFARLTASSERSLADFETRAVPGPAIQRRLDELQRLVDALAEVMKREAIGRWLQQPNDAFQGLKPLEVIERGEVDRLWEMIFRIRSGQPG